VGREVYSTPTILKLCAAASRSAAGYFKVLLFLSIFMYYSFKRATKLLGQMVSKSFGPNYVINRSVRDLFWSMNAVNRESVGIAAVFRNVQTFSIAQPACYSIGQRAFSLDVRGRVLAAEHTLQSNAEDNNL
jgi:hypothetical protein